MHWEHIVASRICCNKQFDIKDLTSSYHRVPESFSFEGNKFLSCKNVRIWETELRITDNPSQVQMSQQLWTKSNKQTLKGLPTLNSDQEPVLADLFLLLWPWWWWRASSGPAWPDISIQRPAENISKTSVQLLLLPLPTLTSTYIHLNSRRFKE